MEMVNPGVYERSVRDLAKEWTWLREDVSAARLQFVRVVQSERPKCCPSRKGGSTYLK